jgi:hypothetical protein
MTERDFPSEIEDTAQHIERVGLHFDAKTLRDAAAEMRMLLGHLREKKTERMLGHP